MFEFISGVVAGMFLLLVYQKYGKQLTKQTVYSELVSGKVYSTANAIILTHANGSETMFRSRRLERYVSGHDVGIYQCSNGSFLVRTMDESPFYEIVPLSESDTKKYVARYETGESATAVIEMSKN